MNSEKLSEKININHLKPDFIEEFDIDKDIDWVRKILLEMIETSPLEQKEALAQSEIKGKVKIQRVQENAMGEIVILELSWDSSYQTSCVRSLEPMSLDLSFEVSLAFLPDHLKDEDMYLDQTEVYAKQAMRELYFLKKGEADLYQAINEQVFVNYDYYPKKQTQENDTTN